MTFLENIVLFLSKSEKNNNQTVSGGKRQGKVYGIVTPVFGSIKLSATEKNTRPNLTFMKYWLEVRAQKWQKNGTSKLNIFKTSMI